MFEWKSAKTISWAKSSQKSLSDTELNPNERQSVRRSRKSIDYLYNRSHFRERATSEDDSDEDKSYWIVSPGKKSQESRDINRSAINRHITRILNSRRIFNAKQLYSAFMMNNFCFDLMPVSGRVLTIDVDLKLMLAFRALIADNTRSSVLYDSKVHRFVGVLSVTDLIHLLVTNHTNPSRDCDSYTIRFWRQLQINNDMPNHPFITATPNTNLLDAVCILSKYHLHRLPIIDPQSGNYLHQVTYKRILKFLFLSIYNMPTVTIS
ncbi:hypothetical protein ACOME3_009710 [Neoechinorhynchus agilis]